MKLIPYSQLRAEKGITYTREHLRRLEKVGAFPQHIKLADSPNAHTAWAESDINNWIEQRRAKRDGGA
jgi:predicted DNA-binding transcriptional regulator AlpA